MTDLSSNPAPQPKSKLPLWIKIALTVSLVLNLGLVGMLAGLATRSVRSEPALTAAIAALPERDRRELRREARDGFQAMREQSSVKDAREALFTALTAEQFDPAAFEQALGRGRGNIAAVSADLRAKVVARVMAMTLNERRAYAAELSKRLDRRSTAPTHRP